MNDNDQCFFEGEKKRIQLIVSVSFYSVNISFRSVIRFFMQVILFLFETRSGFGFIFFIVLNCSTIYLLNI